MRKVSLILFVCSFLFTASLKIINAEEVELIKSGGVYSIPIRLNGVLSLHFIVDSGASEVSIPADVVLTLLRTGTISEADFLPGKFYTMADGSVVRSPRFLLKSIQVGNHVYHNVIASLGNVNGLPLLGQSLLEKFGAWSMDAQRQVLIIGDEPPEYLPPNLREASNHPAEYLPPNLRGASNAPPEYSAKEVDDPIKAVLAFVNSVALKNYQVSWSSLSSYSQNQITASLAREAKMEHGYVRQLFDENNPALQESFWRAFRDKSGFTQSLESHALKIVKQEPGIVSVRMASSDRWMVIKVYQEGDRWKVGLLESIEEARQNNLGP